MESFELGLVENTELRSDSFFLELVNVRVLYRFCVFLDYSLN